MWASMEVCPISDLNLYPCCPGRQTGFGKLPFLHELAFLEKLEKLLDWAHILYLPGMPSSTSDKDMHRHRRNLFNCLLLQHDDLWSNEYKQRLPGWSCFIVSRAGDEAMQLLHRINELSEIDDKVQSRISANVIRRAWLTDNTKIYNYLLLGPGWMFTVTSGPRFPRGANVSVGRRR